MSSENTWGPEWVELDSVALVVEKLAKMIQPSSAGKVHDSGKFRVKMESRLVGVGFGCYCCQNPDTK